MKIQIINWNEYVPRKDLKSLSWFRVDCDIMFSPKFHKTDPKIGWFFICLLGFCGKKAIDTVDLPEDYLRDVTGCDPNKCLKVLEENGLVRICTDSYGSVTNNTNITNNTNNTNITNNTRSKESFELDNEQIEIVYKSYPKKSGDRRKAFQRIKKNIKSEKQWEEFKQAQENYINQNKNENRETKYYKNYEVFCNDFWKNYINPEKDINLTNNKNEKFWEEFINQED